MNLPKSKDEFVATLHEAIDATSRKIDELRVQARLGEAEAKDKVNERIEDLEQKRDGLRDQLRQLKDSTGSAVEALQEGCSRSWDEFKNAVDKAIGEFKK